MPGSVAPHPRLMLLCALSLLAHAAPARAQAPTNPDFSNVTDILHGRRTLFPVDDIVVSFNVAGSPTLTTILQTAGGSISGQTQYTAASPSPSAQPLLVAAARMFNLPRAVVVTLFAGSTNLHDQTSGLSQSFPNAVAPTLAPTTTYAVTDLAGNGYAAIVFIGNMPQAPTPNVPGGAIGTVMAANVNDPTQGFFYGTPMPLPQQTLVGFEFGGIAAGDFDGDGANEIAVSYLGALPAALLWRQPHRRRDLQAERHDRRPGQRDGAHARAGGLGDDPAGSDHRDDPDGRQVSREARAASWR